MSDLRERAERLRERAAPLEPDAGQRRALREAVVGHAEEFLEDLRRGPGWIPPTGSPDIAGLELPATGKPVDELLSLVRREVERQGLNPASPRDLGWVPGGGLYASALGDYLAAVGNAFAGYFPASPGAVILENRLVDWLASLVGYPPTAGGNLASGGSVAGVTAVIAARDAHGLKGADFARAVVYVTDQAHYSVRKAVHLAGVGEAPCRIVPVDSAWRMAPEALARQVRKDKRDGLRPWLVASGAGTTNTGAVDPLDAISDIARAEGLWHHSDAAYGGFFLLVPSRRPLFRGIERADSVVLDPHKSLFLPYGTGALVVRNAEHLKTLRFAAPYLVDAPQAEPSPSERSIELTKHFRGLRMLFPLLLHGTDAFTAALEEKCLLARYLQEELAGWPEITVGAPPQLSTMCFRWAPAGKSPEEADDANRRLLDAIHADGRIFVTATILEERFWIRPCIGIFRTHAEHVEEFLSVLREMMDRLSG